MASILSHIQNSAQQWGVEGDQVPAMSLETVPGDVVIFVHNLKHASFGGGSRRRMFTINCCQQAGPNNLHMLEQCVRDHLAYGIEGMCSDTMVNTAGPDRWVHLRQLLDAQRRVIGRK